MSATNTISFRIILLNSKKNSAGESPLYIRININGKFADIAIKRRIHTSKWNSSTGTVKGTKEEARALNSYLEKVKAELWETYYELIRKEEEVTAELIKRRYLKTDSVNYTLLQAIGYHNKNFKERVGIDYAPATAKRFETLEQHIRIFLVQKLKCTDIPLSKLYYKFIIELEHYFKVDKKCNHNTSLKYIRNLKKIITQAYRLNWIEKDPFLQFNSKLEPTERVYLTKEELDLISSKEITIERLDIVRDLFIFSCYTGLAYADVQKLTPQNVAKGNDGEFWIFTSRTKTEVKSNVPLLKVPLKIIEKYKMHPECIYSGKLLPSRSNQKLNAYLKELSDICGINKNISFHTARHTFATTVTLTNDVPIESVSAMLGHKSIRTTQIYAKVIETKVSNDMKKLKLLLEK